MRYCKFVFLIAVFSNTAIAQMSASKVAVESAKLIDAPSTMSFVATVDPYLRTRVCTEVEGLVVIASGREGDLVEAGEVICSLDTDLLKLDIAQAEAELDRLQARYDELVAGTRPQLLKQREAMYGEALATLERWQFELERVTKLYGDDDSNAKEVVDARTEAEAAERRMVAARAAFELAKEGERKEVIAQAAFHVAAQKAVVDKYKLELEKAQIRAPFGGFITMRGLEVGQWVDRGGEVAELIDLHAVLVRVAVPEFAIAFVKEGQPAEVSVDALKRSFPGVVKHIVRQADESARTFEVQIEVGNREGLLAGGMFARASVVSGPSGKIVAVPRDAVVETMGIKNVGIVMPGEQGSMMALLQPVTVGAEVGDWIAITSGNIQPGMQVVTRGNENLMPFPTPVIPVDSNGNPLPMPAQGGPGEAGGPGVDGQGQGSSEGGEG